MAKENFMGVPYDAIRQMEEVYKGISKEPVLTTVLGVLALTTNEFAPKVTRGENSFEIVFEDTKRSLKSFEDPSVHRSYICKVRCESEKNWFLGIRAKSMICIGVDNGSSLYVTASLDESMECGEGDSPSVFIIDGLRRVSIKMFDDLKEIIGKFEGILND